MSYVSSESRSPSTVFVTVQLAESPASLIELTFTNQSYTVVLSPSVTVIL